MFLIRNFFFQGYPFIVINEPHNPRFMFSNVEGVMFGAYNKQIIIVLRCFANDSQKVCDHFLMEKTFFNFNVFSFFFVFGLH